MTHSQRVSIDLARVFPGDSELACLMRKLDWSRTPFGTVSTWPDSLKTAVAICLTSRFPMVMWWGPDLLMLYNDAWRPVLGQTKHPAIAKPGREVWPEVWHIIGPMLEGVLTTGQATWQDDQLLLLDRNGYLEEAYFTYSYSPIHLADGTVGGAFSAVSETTGRVLGERRLRTLRDLGAQAALAKTEEEACRITMGALTENQTDVPFALLYLLSSDGACLTLSGSTPENVPPAWCLRSLDVSVAAEQDNWRLAEIVRTGQPIVLKGLHRRVGSLPHGPWSVETDTALVLPLAAPGQERAAGVLVVGINPCRVLDEAYDSFLRLLAGHIATTIANAHAYEAERGRAEALAELDRAKTAFFSNVSHEFRTPLTLLLGPLEELLSGGRSDLSSSAIGQLEVAHRNSLRLLKLVNTLLDFSRIEAGRIRANYLPTDLASFTAELAGVFRSAIEQAGLRLLVDCPPLPEPVYVDRDMWEQIVLNLLSNAFKFTFTGEIAVGLKLDGGQVELSVCDTGIGIVPDELPKIFDRFHRVEGAQGRTHEGTGIGLALVQELATLHGGTAQADSAPGKGSRFRVTIPTGTSHVPQGQLGVPAALTSAPALTATSFVEEALRWVPSEAGVRSAESSVLSESQLPNPYTQDSGLRPQHAMRPRVLVADDNADMREYIRRLLAERYEVETAPDGAAALAAARAQRPDLILSDVMMPGLDGFGLLRALRDGPDTKTIPIMLLSARAGEESRIEGLEQGADDYLIKPFTARELLARVGVHVTMARIRREAAAAQSLLYELANAVNRAEALSDLYGKALDTILTSLNADRASILLFDEDGVMRFKAWRGISDGYRRRVEGHSPWHKDTLDPRPIVIGNIAEAGIDRQLQILIQQEGIQALGFIPLTYGGRLLGKFMVYFNRPYTMNDAEISLGQAIAGTLALGIERKMAEASLRETKAALDFTLESAEVGDWDLDLIHDTSRRSLRHDQCFGYNEPVAEWGFERFIEHVHPEDRARIERDFHTAVTELADWHIECRVVWPDGSVHWIATHGSIYRTEEGKAVRMLGIVANITERKQAEEGLRRFNDELEVRVAERTEELTQSQASLRALATELNLTEQRERKRMATELHDYLAQLLVLGKMKLGQGKRLAEAMPGCAELINQTDKVLTEALTYTRTLVAELSPPVLHDFGLPAALRWLGERMQTHRLAVTVQIESADVTLPEDQAMLLFQSVRELLMNAAKYAKSGRASVELARLDGQLQISVRDDGVGFDLAAAAADATTAFSSKFGLYSIRERMRALGGRFELQSAPGKGTTATLVLPLAMRDERETRDKRDEQDYLMKPARSVSRVSPISPVPQHARIRVLLVDDHAMVRQGLRSVLDSYADIEVVGEAWNGEEAVALVERLQPAIVLMDINMPKMNGIDATIRIKARYPHTIVIGLSVNAGGANEEAMRNVGAAMLLTKEAAVDELYRAIQETLSVKVMSKKRS